MKTERYWIAVISKEHAMRGVAGNFIQVCHGKQGPLKRMQANDWIIIYSPKLQMEGKEPLQCFTAIGQVADEHIYPFQMTETFVPFRRNVHFRPCKEASILPLIAELDFIPNKKSWGYPFRFGVLEIQEQDFNRIMTQMLSDEIVGEPVSF